jgi:hypothetical protein
MAKEAEIAKEGRRSRMIEEQEIHLTALSWLRSSNSFTTTFLEAQNLEKKLLD